MKAVSVVFEQDNKKDGMFLKLSRVFEKTWHQNTDIPLSIYPAEAPVKGDKTWAYYANLRVMEVLREKFDQDTIYVDVDMMCRSCPCGGFNGVKWLGIPRAAYYPFNAGVMFLKHKAKTKRFLDDLIKTASEMQKDESLRLKWAATYQGFIQAAIGKLLNSKYPDIDFVSDKYNKTAPWENWKHASLIHIKSDLRRWVTDTHNDAPKYIYKLAQTHRALQAQIR